MTILIIRAEEGWIDCKWKVDCIWIVSALNQKSLVGFWGFLSFSQSKFIKKQKIYCELLSLASQLLPSWFSVARNNRATHCYASACEKDNHRCLTFKLWAEQIESHDSAREKQSCRFNFPVIFNFSDFPHNAASWTWIHSKRGFEGIWIF